jgi:hypothetical protein
MSTLVLLITLAVFVVVFLFFILIVSLWHARRVEAEETRWRRQRPFRDR